MSAFFVVWSGASDFDSAAYNVSRFISFALATRLRTEGEVQFLDDAGRRDVDQKMDVQRWTSIEKLIDLDTLMRANFGLQLKGFARMKPRVLGGAIPGTSLRVTQFTLFFLVLILL